MGRTALSITAVIAVVIVGTGLWRARAAGPLRDPNEALADFYAGQDRAEDQLMDPLILAGPRVAPLVIEAIRDPQMKRRRYAIAYLGITQRQEAVPRLLAILRESSEIYYFRSDALEALYRIDPTLAESEARNHTNGPELLGRVAGEMVSGSYSPPYERPWWDAFRSVHH